MEKCPGAKSATVSLYGIETDNDCRRTIDALLELHRRAEQQPTKETVGALKAALKACYNKRDDSKMSEVESRCFRPAVTEAYVHAPNLNSPKTWRDGLYDIQWDLRKYRPE